MLLCMGWNKTITQMRMLSFQLPDKLIWFYRKLWELSRKQSLARSGRTECLSSKSNSGLCQSHAPLTCETVPLWKQPKHIIRKKYNKSKLMLIHMNACILMCDSYNYFLWLIHRRRKKLEWKSIQFLLAVSRLMRHHTVCIGKFMHRRRAASDFKSHALESIFLVLGCVWSHAIDVGNGWCRCVCVCVFANSPCRFNIFAEWIKWNGDAFHSFQID